MKTNFIVTEGYPKWIYINPSCRECDKRIAIGAIPNSSYPFIFIAKESESILKGDKIFKHYKVIMVKTFRMLNQYS